VIHGDLKLSNLLFESASGEGRDRAHALVDFDTLMRGTLWMELGDLWRSWCNAAGEDAQRPRFDLEVFAASGEGFAAGYGAPLEAVEVESLAAAPERITLELCARFVTDALEEHYFGWGRGALCDPRRPQRRPGRGPMAALRGDAFDGRAATNAAPRPRLSRRLAVAPGSTRPAAPGSGGADRAPSAFHPADPEPRFPPERPSDRDPTIPPIPGHSPEASREARPRRSLPCDSPITPPCATPSSTSPLAIAVEEAGFDTFTLPDSICYPEVSDSKYPYNGTGDREFLDGVPFLEPLLGRAGDGRGDDEAALQHVGHEARDPAARRGREVADLGRGPDEETASSSASASARGRTTSPPARFPGRSAASAWTR
jgi:hypothetical protein